MIFEQLAIGGDKNFAYLVGDKATNEVAVVDPGCDPGTVMNRLKELGTTCPYILATHSHYDHVAGVDVVKGATGAKFAAYKTVPGVDMPLEDGDTVSIGSVKIRIVFCPGHCADSVLLVINEEKVIAGDEIFIGGVGITRSEEQARLHYNNLHSILMKLDDGLELYVGHDYGAKPVSTIGEQRRDNPYLQQPDFDSFWHLRQNWKQYVKDHGLQWG